VSIREQVKPLHGVSGTDQHGTSVWSSFRPFRRIGPLRGQCHLIGIGSEATAGGGMRSHASLDCPTLIVEVERYDWRPRHASVQSNVGKTRASLARSRLGYIKIHVTPHLQKMAWRRDVFALPIGFGSQAFGSTSRASRANAQWFGRPMRIDWCSSGTRTKLAAAKTRCAQGSNPCAAPMNHRYWGMQIGISSPSPHRLATVVF